MKDLEGQTPPATTWVFQKHLLHQGTEILRKSCSSWKLRALLPGKISPSCRDLHVPFWAAPSLCFHVNPAAAPGLLFFVSITRCQCVATPSRHGQAVVEAGSHQWTSTGHPSACHLTMPTTHRGSLGPDVTGVWLWILLTASLLSLTHMPREGWAAPEDKNKTLRHRVPCPIPVLQPCLHLLCQDPPIQAMDAQPDGSSGTGTCAS